MKKWKGKMAVVTGASAGIGAALVERLLKEGMIVIGIARRKEKIQEIQTRLNEACEGKLHAFCCDVTKEGDILRTFKWLSNNYGPIHVLINNAGISRITSLSAGCTKFWTEIVNTNVLGLCTTTREALRNMKEHKVDGHIIHINSTGGHFLSEIPFHIYTATKYAVTALTETLRLELKEANSKIKITDISPGYVDTEIIEATSLASGGLISKEAAEKFRTENPSLNAEDVVDAVVYALSTPPHVQVIGIARRKEKIQEIQTRLNEACEGTLHAFCCDVTKEGDILRTFKWLSNNYGPIHVLINNAGISRITSLSAGCTKFWTEIVNTNVLGLCTTTREALRNMKEHKVDGHIIHINSTGGHFLSEIPFHIYTATKYAVTALTETLRLELKEANSKIKITDISPGYVDTEIIEATSLASGGLISKEAAEKFRTENPSLNAEDVVDAVVYALSTPPHVQVIFNNNVVHILTENLG
ncbi:hypothetical protein FQA39_LY03744 [Lamprigera yunnana]|nr:hypothetical protein FQA39_LY03744 [Lamprigera yunnana]